MNRLEWTTVVLKLFGFFFLIQAFSAISVWGGSAISVWDASTFEDYSWSEVAILATMLLPIVLPFAAFLILWFRASTIAVRLWKGVPEQLQPSSAGLAAEELELVLLRVLGVYLFIVSVAPLANSVWSVRTVAVHETFEPAMSRAIVGLVGRLLQVGLSLWLILGTSTTLRALSKLRTAGSQR